MLTICSHNQQNILSPKIIMFYSGTFQELLSSKSLKRSNSNTFSFKIHSVVRIKFIIDSIISVLKYSVRAMKCRFMQSISYKI